MVALYIFIEGITDEALEDEKELLKHIGDNVVHDTMVNNRMTTMEIHIKTEGIAACLTLREWRRHNYFDNSPQEMWSSKNHYVPCVTITVLHVCYRASQYLKYQ